MEKIKFIARSQTEYEIQDRPVPAASLVPDWWRNMTPYDMSPQNPEGKKLLVRNGDANTTFKKCTPMLDAITSGYILNLWADVQVTPTDDAPLITWKTHHAIFELHGMSSRKVPPPPGYDNFVYKYLNCWIPVTPPGYSVLITAPFGYRDLPFLAIPAIIDSDKSTLELVFPMWIRSGLDGIVDHGTPMIQITPFKRTEWKSEFDYIEDGKYKNIIKEKNFNKTIINHYKKRHWSKKTYK